MAFALQADLALIFSPTNDPLNPLGVNPEPTRSEPWAAPGLTPPPKENKKKQEKYSLTQVLILPRIMLQSSLNCLVLSSEHHLENSGAENLIIQKSIF